MDQAKGAEIEGGVDERRGQLWKYSGRKFPHRGSRFMLLGVLGHEGALYGNMFSRSRSNSTVRSAPREIAQSPQRDRETIIQPPVRSEEIAPEPGMDML
jgi:hypothetical protein